MPHDRAVSAGRGEPRVMGMGLLALDVVFGAEEGSLPECFAGGTCGNVLTVLSFLGWRSEPVSRLGDGDVAELVVRDLRRWRVSDEFIWNDPDAKTPVVIETITRADDGEPHHRFSWRCPFCGGHLARYRPVVASAIPDVAEKMQDTDVFFFDRVSRGALVLAASCRERGSAVVFEPSAGVRERRLLEEAWELADVVKYSHERAADITGDELGIGRAGGPVLEIETWGSAGLRYRSRLENVRGRQWIECAAIPVRWAKDAAGAGDWCTAGLVDRLCRNGRAGFLETSDGELRSALSYGQALASWACGFEGARGGMYEVTRAELEQEIGRVLTGREIRTAGGQGGRRRREEVLGAFCATCEQHVMMAPVK